MMFPPMIVRIVIANTTTSQSGLIRGNITSKTRVNAINAAALVPTDMNAVTGAGAPT